MLEVFIMAMSSAFAGALGGYLLWDWLDERRETRRERARQKRLQLRRRPRKKRDKNLHPPLDEGEKKQPFSEGEPQRRSWWQRWFGAG
jgi:uracil-DNA glycosylase